MLHYKNIGLTPRYSDLNSRADADTSIEFLRNRFRLPVIPANMATTIDFKLAADLSESGYFYILHRFYDYELIYAWIEGRQKLKNVSISLGVNESDYYLVDKLAKNKLRVDYVTIDTAHAYSLKTAAMIAYVKKQLPETKVIAGNVFGDKNSIEFLQNAGADAIKVGLSFGSGCSTFEKTGFASPMFSAGLEASKWAKVPLIGDGSISSSGDIVKGLVAGFSMIMAGSLFAACSDSPAPFVGGKKHYYGSASAKNKGHNRHIEGKEVLLECNNMTYKEKLEEITQNVQSAISYAGSYNLTGFKTVEWFQL